MRILAATDGSAAATRAVELAARLASEFGGSLKIIHVVTESDADNEKISEYAHSEGYGTAAEAAGALSEEKLRIAKEKAEALGVSHVETASVQELEAGAIADTIIDAGHRDEADMIVMGKRGLSRLSGLILGSVSQKVVSNATCAVTVVP
jgi:nucleotide-binding universal stress UspA family protein